MNKKLKTLFWISSALIANTSIASALTSCSFKDTINDIGNLDKKYGISMVTYNRMESDFRDLYETQQNMSKYEGSISEEEYQSNLLNFESKLNSFHATLFNKDNKSLSYTIRTNALKDFADCNYGIKLSRVTNINLNDELADIKASMLSSLFVYIDSYKVDDNQAIEIIEKANSQFDELKNEAIKNIGSNDNVAVIQYVQNGIVKCFGGICDELDVIIAQQQLKDFLNEYQINIKDNLNQQYYWDNLYAKYGEGNKEIELKDFNNIFIISSKSGQLKVSGTSLHKDFTNDIIPGYTLKPIMYSMESNPYENDYSINIDYTLVENKYFNNNNIARYTVHSTKFKDSNIYKNENISVFEFNEINSERDCMSYRLPITKNFENAQINDVYFNSDDFKFAWSNDKKYGIDNFWTQAPNNEGKLNKSGLADSGMMINGYLLSDLISKVDVDDIDQLPDQEQKAIKLVKNTDFSLDYVENDNEILVNNFNFKYANSEWIFNDDNFDNIIYKAINKESTATKHTSTLLWENIKNHYDEASGIFKNINDAVEDAKSLANTVDNLRTATYIMMSIATTFLAFLFIVMIYDSWSISNDHTVKTVIVSILLFITFMSPSVALVSVVTHYFYENNPRLENALIGISHESEFGINIKNNNKYFYTSEGKPSSEIFDSLDNNSKRNLKNYYCTYKNNESDETKKTQSQKDYENLLNAKKDNDIVKEYVKDSSQTGWIVWTVVAGIEAAIVIFFGIVYYFLIKYKVQFAQNKQALAKSITIILASVISAVTVFIAAFHKI